MSQHFVGDPVEDVEYEETQRKDSSGYGVNTLGPVDKSLAEYLAIVYGNRRRGVEDSGALHRCTILGLQAVTQSITSEVKPTALPHQFLFLWSEAQGKQIGL